jgi:hypothetical protein
MDSLVIFLIGTGALSKAIVDTLSFSYLANIKFHIYGRSKADSTWLATIGNTRSHLRGNRQQFTARQIDWHSESALTDDMNKHKPSIVIHTASLQSMWSLKQDNKWSNLVRETGYGITMPLQCKLALVVAKAISLTLNPPHFINCCYPDAVNYILKKCGYDVLCGIGNIGIIDQLLSNDASVYSGGLLLANHFHVQELTKPPHLRSELPRLWIHGKELCDTRSFFEKVLISNEPSLNSITALTCLRLIAALVDDKECLLHLPGPCGQIGGYPILFKDREIFSVGTGVIDHEDEKHWNKTKMQKEGLVFNEDSVRFSEKTFESINKYSAYLAEGFSFIDTNIFINNFVDFKERLSVLA